MEPIRSHDGLFRFVFREPEQMAELLRACLPAIVADAIDWSTLRRLDGSFVDKALQGRRTDMLFSARLESIPVLLHVVCEHKSNDDRFTSLQVAGYVIRVLDHWLAENPNAGTLPAVLPFVLYHGERPWQAPRSPDELVDLGSDPVVQQFLRPLQLHLPFHLLDLAHIDESEIEAMRVSAVTGLTLRFLQFLRTCSADEAAGHIVRWQHLVVQLLEHPRGGDVLFALLTWYIAGSPASHETLRTLMTKIHEENPPMRSCLDLLLEMNEERGMRKGLRTMLEAQLRTRFGEVPAHLQERLAAADAALLQQWGVRAVTATCIDEVFAG